MSARMLLTTDSCSASINKELNRQTDRVEAETFRNRKTPFCLAKHESVASSRGGVLRHLKAERRAGAFWPGAVSSDGRKARKFAAVWPTAEPFVMRIAKRVCCIGWLKDAEHCTAEVLMASGFDTKAVGRPRRPLYSAIPRASWAMLTNCVAA
jgi:hypothetical protein